MDEASNNSGRGSLFNKLAILVVILILGVALFGEKGVVRLVKLMRERENLAAEVQKLKDDNQRLRQEIEALRSDQRYLEQLARKELGMVREDEVVYQFRPENKLLSKPDSEQDGNH